MIASRRPTAFDKHAVCAYRADDDLVTTIAAVLSSALADGAIVVIATADHARGVMAGLVSAGHDMDTLLRTGRALVLDAAHVISSITTDGDLEPRLFESVVGTPLRRLAAKGEVTAFGEMVGLLWADGDLELALELEDEWNRLGQRVPLRLICGYPAGDLSESPHANEVDHRHACRVDEARCDRFEQRVESIASARAFAEATMLTWGRPDLASDVKLIVSELATNSVLHASSRFYVLLERAGNVVSVVVGDESPAPPVASSPGDDRRGGRGLLIVEGLAESWGYAVGPATKRVWADIAR